MPPPPTFLRRFTLDASGNRQPKALGSSPAIKWRGPHDWGNVLRLRAAIASHSLNDADFITVSEPAPGATLDKAHFQNVTGCDPVTSGRKRKP